ncbi:MAG: cysteine desulfurase family protein [Alphaproteobacteria bacterium]
MHSLVKTRIYQMAKSTGTALTPAHMSVLEYAWDYYRKRRVGPLFNNIRRKTGLTRDDIGSLFPNGLSSVYTWVGIPIQSTKAGCKPMALIEVENPREVYFDNNATTPLRKEIAGALVTFFEDQRSFGNPSSSYTVGGQAYDVIDQARRSVAACLAVNPDDIFFTGSGSEANNLAIKGIAARYDGGHIVSTNVEHPSVLKTLKHLESRGFDITYLPVAGDGTLAASAVADAIRADTILVSVMAANNEIGTLFPIAEIGAICRARNVPFHVDAVQAFGKIALSPKESGIDVLTLSGHKINAPKGVGAIYIGESVELDPLIHGGSQEAGVRAGTENVAGIMALGLAAKLTCAEMEESDSYLHSLRDHFLGRLRQIVPDAIVNGSMEHRLPHNLSIGFPDVDSGSMLLSFNQIGISVSAGSACSAGDENISHVIQAIGTDSDHFGTIRFSFGTQNSVEEIDYLFEHIPAILAQLQENTADQRRIA